MNNRILADAQREYFFLGLGVGAFVAMLMVLCVLILMGGYWAKVAENLWRDGLLVGLGFGAFVGGMLGAWATVRVFDVR